MKRSPLRYLERFMMHIALLQKQVLHSFQPHTQFIPSDSSHHSRKRGDTQGHTRKPMEAPIPRPGATEASSPEAASRVGLESPESSPKEMSLVVSPSD